MHSIGLLSWSETKQLDCFLFTDWMVKRPERWIKTDPLRYFQAVETRYLEQCQRKSIREESDIFVLHINFGDGAVFSRFPPVSFHST